MRYHQRKDRRFLFEQRFIQHALVTVYCPIYQLTYCGREYSVCEETYYSNTGVPKVGEYRELLIDPKNPEALYVKKRGMLGEKLLFVVVSVILGAAMAYRYYINYM